MIGADARVTVNVDSLTPPRPAAARSAVSIPEGSSKLTQLREGWSEVLDLLSSDYWLCFFFMFDCLTIVTAFVLVIIFAMS